MKSAWQNIARFSHSLYARIALVYLGSLVLLSIAAAWLALSQFNQLGREVQQRMQINLAGDLAKVMQTPLQAGPASAAAQRSAQHILSINPSVSLYLLDAHGDVIGNYAQRACGRGAQVDVAALQRILGKHPMLPVFTRVPCSQRPRAFSVARIHYGGADEPGYLLAVLHTGTSLSMLDMLRTSSITRTLIVAGLVALLFSGVVGLILFALITRPFSRLTRAVQHFAEGDYGQRIPIARDDEMGRLARAFNEMAGTIEAQLDALREDDRQRRELVANLSHDFRTPLTSVQGYAEQLRASGALTDPHQRESIDAILTNVQRLTELAWQLSTLARIDAHGQPLQIEPFSLADLAQDIVGKFQPQAQSAGITLEARCAPGLPFVAADLALIDRAIANLIDNALHATPAGGNVQVSAASAADRVIVAVRDSGIGLNAEDAALITQRFYRTAASRSDRDGSGLGLAIVEEICQRHGTRLSIESAPGRGTRMQFDLTPAAR